MGRVGRRIPGGRWYLSSVRTPCRAGAPKQTNHQGRFAFGASKPSLLPYHNELVCSRFCAPNLPGPTQKLADRGVRGRQREGAESLGRRVEAQNCVCRKVAQPHLPAPIDVNRVRPRPNAGQPECAPFPTPCVVAQEISRVPSGDPQASLCIRPDPSRALPWGRRPDDIHPRRRRIDLAEIATACRVISGADFVGWPTHSRGFTLPGSRRSPGTHRRLLPSAFFGTWKLPGHPSAVQHHFLPPCKLSDQLVDVEPQHCTLPAGAHHGR